MTDRLDINILAEQVLLLKKRVLNRPVLAVKVTDSAVLLKEVTECLRNDEEIA